MKTYTCYVDGASRGNPGPAGIGIVIFDATGKIVAQVNKYIGIVTNNVAEYQALILALDTCLKFTTETVKIFIDSELILKQVKGIFRVREMHLKQLLNDVISRMSKFNCVEFKYIPRNKNKLADKLANVAINLGVR